MKEQALESLGLNKKQIAVYLANLELGSSSVQQIAMKAGLNRTSTYDILSSLETIGFVNYVIISKIKYYQAKDPEKLADLLREKRALIKKALPELKGLAKSAKHKSKIEIYVGVNGLKSILEDILNNSKFFLAITSKRHMSSLLKYYFKHFINRRIKAGIKVKLIIDEEPLDKNAQYKLIKGRIKTGTWIYNGRVAIISFEEKEPIGILIHEKNFYETQRLMFNLLWNALDKPKRLKIHS